MALNAHLRPHPIAVLSAEEAAPEFHARFDAVRRVYLYSHPQSPRARGAFARQGLARIARTLDADAMHEAAQRLIGQHDFTTFRDAIAKPRAR